MGPAPPTDPPRLGPPSSSHPGPSLPFNSKPLSRGRKCRCEQAWHMQLRQVDELHEPKLGAGISPLPRSMRRVGTTMREAFESSPSRRANKRSAAIRPTSYVLRILRDHRQSWLQHVSEQHVVKAHESNIALKPERMQSLQSADGHEILCTKDRCWWILAAQHMQRRLVGRPSTV